jgi:hypothetical protein
MSEIVHGAHPQGVSSEAGTDAGARTGWKRSHLVWFFIALSMVPGVAAAAFREEWSGLPAGVRLSAYIVSGTLISVACTLILRADPATEARPETAAAPPRDEP